MDWVTERFQQFDRQPVAIDESGVITYADLIEKIVQWREAITKWNINPGERVGLVSDYRIDSVALLHALLERGCIVMPVADDDTASLDERLKTISATRLLTIAAAGDITPATTQCLDVISDDAALHPLLESMISAGKPGFVIFTSGSTGQAKAVLLDYGRMTQKYRNKVRQSYRTLLFLKLDHIGGLNTLFSVIFNGGTIVTCASRQSRDICQCIEQHAVELLPTTPSFLTMLLMSGMHAKYNMSSLQVITYGTEAMPESTLSNLHRVLPSVTLKQTYGLSELGILATQSRDSSSKWMKIGGAGFELSVRDDILWIRSEQAMLGYLNAPSPFDSEGWYNTGDKVKVDGDYFCILGRESEIINVAGEKVYPVEVESFLLTLGNVKDVVVREKKSPVVGQLIWAEFLLEHEEDPVAFKKRILEQCRRSLSPFKIPGLVTITSRDCLVGSRYKKIRKGEPNILVDAPVTPHLSITEESRL